MLNTSRYRIIAIGKVRKSWIQSGLALYLKRLPGLSITELRDASPQHESRAIRASLRRDETMIVLTEEGNFLSSREFATHLQGFGSTRLTFVIGGADGLTSELKESASWKLSLSRMTFTHEMARLLLVEQLYRAQSILQKGAYHRGE